MKRTNLLQKLSRYALTVILLLTMTGWKAYAESIASERHLTEILDEISEKYQVFFTYNKSLLKDIKIDYELSESVSLQTAINQVLSLANTYLQYQHLGNNYYVIFQDSKQGRKSVRKLQRKVDQLEKLEKKEGINVQYRNNKIGEHLKQVAQSVEARLLASISGTVTNENGDPLAGATIRAKGVNLGVISDDQGKFTLEVPDEVTTLIVSYFGYERQEVLIEGRTTLNIVMVESNSFLDAVVVVGYGTVKKSDVTGAVSSVSGSELSEVATSNVLDQAQGRLAGVDIVRGNGSPGSPLNIRVRGNRSISANNDPLFVIDGIPTTQGINDFNPADIASMEILKDASAVAIYGSRGANGVILITTKRGQQGKATISYNGYYGAKNAIENLDKMNGRQFAEYVRVANGLAKDDASQDVSLLGEQIEANLRNGVETDWLDEVLRTGSQQEHQLSASGGSDNVKYYLSGSYFLEDGVLEKANYERFSIRTNIDANLTPKANVGISLTASRDLRNQMSNSPITNGIRYNPLVVPFNEEGNIIAFPNPSEGLVTSPLLEYVPNQYIDETKGFRFFSNLFGEYAFTDYLSYRLNFGADLNSARRGRFSGDYDGSSTTGSIGNTDIFSYTVENILTFDNSFGEHNLNVVGLFSAQSNVTETSGLQGRDIAINRSTFRDLGSSATITGISSGLEDWGLLSYMARVNYQFKNRYLLTASGRADGSSRLAEGNKWAFFPAVSVAWIISGESFMNSRVLSFLKLRAGYGQVGNTSINPYQTLGGLARTVYAFGDDGAFGFGQSGIANPDLGWEISKTINIGIDFGLWNDRITGTLELYDTQTDDLLLTRLIPITSGFNSVLENVGATRNRGWELTLSGNAINSSSGFTWDIGLNLFSNREEIVELFNGAVDDVGNRWFIGYPINVFYDHQFDGIWQTSDADQAMQFGSEPGQIKIADVNGRDANGVLTNQPDGEINTDDRTILGSTVPDWSGGLTNQIKFKGLDFSMLIYTRRGQMINSSFHDLGANNFEGRYANLNFNYWTPNNPSNEIPQPRAGGAPRFSSALRYYDGSFIKIKNVTLGYDLARDLLRIPGVSSMRLYVSAVNPLIISGYDLVDPETVSPLSTSTYLAGINLKF